MRRWFLMTIVTLFALPVLLSAETTQREARVYCVDIVLLKGGVELRGSVLSRDDQELRMVVQREWLTSQQPGMAKSLDDEFAAQAEANHKELIDRITAWKAERAGDARLVSALDEELRRLERPNANGAAPPSQFQIVTVPNDRVKRVFRTNDRSRQLALVAWEHQLPHVETATFGTLKSAVEKKVANWEKATVDLTDRLSSGLSHPPDEWAARQAIFEYEYRQRVDFQGSGSYLVRVGEGAERPNLAEILSQTTAEALKSGLSGDELKGLGLGLGTQANPSAAPDDGLAKVIEQATKLDTRGFCVTRVASITGTGPATVKTQFYARLSDSKYHVIWSNESSTDPSTIKNEDIARIEQDPQVQEITKFARALSLGDNATTAVRFGAAIQASLRTSDARFFEFRQRYNNTLNGPPLSVPPATSGK
ncbi:MAG: hypothetical protein U0929_13030 [Planctomycetaceae bacterium]